jgi:formiminoglutamate deiminase
MGHDSAVYVVGSVVTSYWSEHAWLPTGLARSVRISISDGRFVGVEPKAQRRPEDVRLRGVVLPGLANAHSHVFQRALRGRTQNVPDAGLAWPTAMYAVADRLNPDLYLALARATYAEMALAGYTVVGEFHYLHHGPGGEPYADPNAMGAALAKAASEVGIRLTLLDAVHLHGGLTADGYLPNNPVQKRFCDGSVDAWADRMHSMQQTVDVRRGAAIHSIRLVSRDEIAAVVEAVGDVPLHVSISEKPAENLACQMYYGRTPTQLLSDVGALGLELTAVHATHLSDEDIDLLADQECQVASCPTSELDLGEGTGPIRRLLEAGVRVALGSDTQAVIDPFAEMRLVEMHERTLSNERGRIPAATLVRSGSLDGYQSLGWYDGGSLAPGMLADFVAVDMESVRTIGSKAAEVVYTASAADVLTVVVGGRLIVQDGRHAFGPVAPLMREALSSLRDGT